MKCTGNFPFSILFHSFVLSLRVIQFLCSHTHEWRNQSNKLTYLDYFFQQQQRVIKPQKPQKWIISLRRISLNCVCSFTFKMYNRLYVHFISLYNNRKIFFVWNWIAAVAVASASASCRPRIWKYYTRALHTAFQ